MACAPRRDDLGEDRDRDFVRRNRPEVEAGRSLELRQPFGIDSALWLVAAIVDYAAVAATSIVAGIRTQECIPVEVPGRGRKDAVLGMLPSMKDFRYEFRERF